MREIVRVSVSERESERDRREEKVKEIVYPQKSKKKKIII